MTSEERQAALDQARQGDAVAWGNLLESFRPYLRFIAQAQGGNRLQGKLDGSDLVQNGFLEAHRSFGSFRGTTVEELAGWLRQIVARTTGHALRALRETAKRDQTREQSLAGLSSDLADSISTPSTQAIRHEQSAHIATALSRLPEDMQQVLLGRHLEKLPYETLAERLGRSPGAVRVLYTRALRQLRDQCAPTCGVTGSPPEVSRQKLCNSRGGLGTGKVRRKTSRSVPVSEDQQGSCPHLRSASGPDEPTLKVLRGDPP